MKPKLIIVASGLTALDYKSGQEIDKFDIVVRFNGYQHGLGKYDEYVGTKTDVLFCNNTEKSLSDLTSFSSIYMDSIKFVLKQVKKSKTKDLNNKKIKNLLLNNYNASNIIHYKNIVREINKNEKFITMHPGIRNPTLGLMSIFYCVTMYENYEVYIHGFDRISKTITNRKYMSHYYQDKPNFNTKHAVKRETSTIRRLINNDFIKRFISK